MADERNRGQEGAPTVSKVEASPLEYSAEGQLPGVLAGNTEGVQAQNVLGPPVGSGIVLLSPVSFLSFRRPPR